MRIAITGSTGLIGTALVEWFSKNGHSITRIVRDSHPSGANRCVVWDPNQRRIDAAALEGHDVVIHLAGESIASGRWTAERKARIRDSRIQGTSLISETLAKLSHRPRVLLSASAIGYYGNRDPNETLDESSKPGSGFLAEVCSQWEQATAPAQAAGIRVVNMRFGIVLSSRGGALAKMLPPFKLGVGGKIGSGNQIMSWIALDEIPTAVSHLIANEALSGPVNFVSPNPVSNAEFTRVLGRVLSRPTIFPVPALAAKIMFGEMADELLLGGARVIPKKLQESGYKFTYPNLEQALKQVLDQ